MGAKWKKFNWETLKYFYIHEMEKLESDNSKERYIHEVESA